MLYPPSPLNCTHSTGLQCENELRYWDGRGGSTGPAEPPLEAVMAEVARLEAAASQNEAELSGMEGGAGAGIRGELDQLKHRYLQSFTTTNSFPR